MRRNKNNQTYEMDGQQVEIDISGEEGRLLADLLKGGKRKSSTNNKKRQSLKSKNKTKGGKRRSSSKRRRI